MTPLIQVQYCDNIIRHQDKQQYSLIGIYGTEYPITTETAVIPQICVNIVLSPELEELTAHAPTEIQIAISDTILTQFVLPPKPTNLPQQHYLMIIQPILNNIIAKRGDQLHVSMIQNQQTIAQSPVLHIV